ncbi:MAG: hypothetical protein NTW21_13080 [Verrucomicrobia bacterium]|nr:hypothetical protein [Verrucomicrobiota bacterium]
MSSLKLEQRRNHILKAALDHLSAASRQVLSTLALIVASVDYVTIEALSPHRPPIPWWLAKPKPPETRWFWRFLSEEPKAILLNRYTSKVAKWKQGAMVKRWMAKCNVATEDLDSVLTDLTRNRGLLQYDGRSHLYELHPVVRSVVTSNLAEGEKIRAGERILDHFTALPHNPYEQAKTMEDVENGLQVVRTLLKLGHHQQAADAYQGDLSHALLFNLEAHVEVLSLLRPFFPKGWGELPKGISSSHAADLANMAGVALHWCGESSAALAAYGAIIPSDIASHDWVNAIVQLRNTTEDLVEQRQFARAIRIDSFALEISEMSATKESVFRSLLNLFRAYSLIGDLARASSVWNRVDPMGRHWRRGAYRQGSAEYHYAQFQFWQGTLQEEYLVAAVALANEDDNRADVRRLHGLRGAWRLQQGAWELAAASFDPAVAMARERRLVDAESETGLALAKYHLGHFTGDDARSEAERLAQLRQPAHRYLATLWLTIGDTEQAKKHALAAFRWAWADGEPYVYRYELTKTTELLREMNVPIPNHQPYNPAEDKPFPWEAAVRAAIDKLRAEKKAKEKAEKQKSD